MDHHGSQCRLPVRLIRRDRKHGSFHLRYRFPMEDDQPLSSEEMIRRAREGFSDTPVPPSTEGIGPVEEPELVQDPLPTDITTRRSRPRLKQRGMPLPPDPFSDRQHTLSPQARARALGMISAIAMLLLGIGVAVALFAANAP